MTITAEELARDKANLQKIKSIAVARRYLADYIAEVERLRAAQVQLWECPDCGFEMHPCHTQEDGSYSCPCCAELRLAEQVKHLREQIRDIRNKTGYFG